MPKKCKDPQILQYSEICKIGAQLRRVKDSVSKHAVKIVVFDDFIQDTQKIYIDILNFLNLPFDGRRVFPKINANKEIYFKTLDRIVSSLFIFQPYAEKIKNALGLRRLGVGLALQWIRYYLNSKSKGRQPIPIDIRKELIEKFHDDVALLSDLIKRDLNGWLLSSP